MRRNYFLSPYAKQDLRDILGYIRRENPRASDKMRKLFNDALQKIGDHPHLGQEREDLTEKSVRFWPVHRSYMVIYDTNTTPVNILRIYNSARDVGILLTQ